MKFWDSSALVPLLVRQRASRRMGALYRADASVFAWWGTKVECDCAIARLERQGKLTPRQANAAFKRLDLLSLSWHEVQPLDTLREVARRFLRVHDLRAAADALQLAAAFLAAEENTSTLEVVALDQRLALAAQKEGFPVLTG